MPAADALGLAVETFRIPSRFRRSMRRHLPPGVLDVIKAAAGDQETIALAANLHKMEPADVQEACKHFLLRILLDPETKGAGLLGLGDNASEADIKLHKRWLLKWLHPDRNPSAWEQALFLKVSAFQPIPAPPPMAAITASTPPKKPASRRTESKRHRPNIEGPMPSERPMAIALRSARPILASMFLAVLIVWVLMSSRNQPQTLFTWLGDFLNG